MKQLILSALLALPLSAAAQAPVNFSWGSKDIQYASDLRPALRNQRDTLVTVWRGERAAVQAVVYAPQATGTLQVKLTEKQKGHSAFTQATAHFVDYVLTNNFQGCGYPPQGLTAYPVPDRINLPEETCQLKAETTRPVWCTLDVSRDAKPGVHKLALEVTDSATQKVVGKLTLSVRVLDRTLPTPADQQFHVDFWQQPYAVSRQYGLKRWSKEHMEALKPYLRLLARSGQKVVSAILFYEPWGDQSFDKFDPMIRTTRRKDGTWSYDYTIFDRWVELCAECGIDRQINCFSMVPWDMSFRYFDEATGKDIDLRTSTSSPEYKALWTSFLQNFATHLKERGWYDKTCIAMDERGLPNMLDAYRVLQEAVPDMKMSLAGTYHKELVDKLYDYCIAYGEDFSPEELAARRAKGWVSTTYTCCSTPEPNIFSNSLPAEGAWLPIYCVANQFDGYLRWAWMNWDDKSMTDSRFRLFAPGDTYCIYPGPRSSVRYERFMEGVAMAEKIRILRETYTKQGNTAALDRLNALVDRFRAEGIPEGETASSLVNALHALLNQ